jgi:hypothetical protein
MVEASRWLVSFLGTAAPLTASVIYFVVKGSPEGPRPGER